MMIFGPARKANAVLGRPRRPGPPGCCGRSLQRQLKPPVRVRMWPATPTGGQPASLTPHCGDSEPDMASHGRRRPRRSRRPLFRPASVTVSGDGYGRGPRRGEWYMHHSNTYKIHNLYIQTITKYMKDT